MLPFTLQVGEGFPENGKMKDHLLFVQLTDTHDNTKKNFHLDLPGLYQLKNIVTVAEVVSLLNQRDLIYRIQTCKTD